MNNRLSWGPDEWQTERGTDGGKRRERPSETRMVVLQVKPSFVHVVDLLGADEAEVADRGVALLSWLGNQLPNVRAVAFGQLTQALEEQRPGRRFLAILEVLSRCDAKVSERLIAKAVAQRPIAELHLHALALARSANVVLAAGELGTAVSKLLGELTSEGGGELHTDLAVDALATLAICEPAAILASAGELVDRLIGLEQTRVLDAILLACQKHCSFAAPEVAAAIDSRWTTFVEQIRSSEPLDGDVPGAMARLLEILRRTRSPGPFEKALKDIEDQAAEFRVLYQLVSLAHGSTEDWVRPLRVRCLRLLRQKEQWPSFARMIAALASVDPRAVRDALAHP